jgi:hypothetical protein
MVEAAERMHEAMREACGIAMAGMRERGTGKENKRGSDRETGKTMVHSFCLGKRIRTRQQTE